MATDPARILTLRFFVSPMVALVMIIGLVHFSTAEARRFAAGGDPEEVKAIEEMERVVGYDLTNGSFSKPYTDQGLEVVLEGFSKLPLYSIKLLEEMTDQVEIPETVLVQKVKPAVGPFIKGVFTTETAEPILDNELERHAKRIQWKIMEKTTHERENRLAMYKNAFQPQLDGLYYQREAMQGLVELGGGDARAILEQILAQTKAVPMQEEKIEVLRASMEALDFMESVRHANLDEKAAQLTQLIFKKRDDKGSATRGFLLWGVRKLGGVESEQAEKGLKQIWQDEKFDWYVRYEAQEILIRKNVISAKDRTLQDEF